MQYVDDIIVWGKTTEEVFEKGDKILQILRKGSFAIEKVKLRDLHRRFCLEE